MSFMWNGWLNSNLRNSSSVSGSILDYAKTINPFANVFTGADTTDLPNNNAKYCVAHIEERGGTWFVSIFGRDNRIYTNYYGKSWIGWQSTVLESDLAYINLASFVTITDTNSARLIYAYFKNGMIFLSFKIKGAESSEAFAKIAPQYAPVETTMGIYSSPTTRIDIGAVAFSMINKTGSISAWKIRDLEAEEEIQFIYAPK